MTSKIHTLLADRPCLRGMVRKPPKQEESLQKPFTAKLEKMFPAANQIPMKQLMEQGENFAKSNKS